MNKLLIPKKKADSSAESDSEDYQFAVDIIDHDENTENPENKIANDGTLSDMDYLLAHQKKTTLSNSDKKDEKIEEKPANNSIRKTSESSSSDSEDSSKEENLKKENQSCENTKTEKKNNSTNTKPEKKN